MGTHSRRRIQNSLRILIIESDRTARNFLNQVLGEFGSVKLVESGPQVFDVAKKYKPELVVVSHDDCDINALCMCRWLKEEREDVSIILLERDGIDITFLREYQAVVDAQIQSPFDPGEFRSLLCQILETQQRKKPLSRHGRPEKTGPARFKSAKNLAESYPLQFASISPLVLLAGLKDQGTGHLKRVSLFSERIAKQLVKSGHYADQITDQFLTDLKYASQLHDIGNVAISDQLLLREGHLEQCEFDAIKQHTTFGTEYLEVVKQEHPDETWLEMVQTVAHCHHEHWNGNGYPRQLNGESIPLAARIVAVADVFDSLTSDRAFRQSLSHDLARNVIANEAGKQFDAHVTEAFLNCFDEICDIRDEINDSLELENAVLQRKDKPTRLAADELSCDTLDKYREKSRETAEKFRETAAERVARMQAAFVEGKREGVREMAEELEEIASSWGLAGPSECALELQKVIDRSDSVDVVGLKLQTLINIIND